MTTKFKPRRRRGFSLVEMLVAMTITATLLTATLAALDASFKSYKMTTEGASTHVVSRIVMTRLMAMIRNGAEFGPYPVDVLDAAQNPVETNFIEFETFRDDDTDDVQITRIERRTATESENGPYELWYIRKDYSGETLVRSEERPLLVKLEEAKFTLEYDIGPRLLHATVDLTIKPDDIQDAALAADIAPPTIRMVSSVSPRRLDESQ